MKILAIESSGKPAGCAVVEDGLLLAEYNLEYHQTHSQTLLPMIDEISRKIDLDLHSLDGIAVSGGPGSFTGLRIGSATAKGIGLALDLPILNVPTLEGLAMNFYGSRAIICPMLDARRSEVFTGIYSFQGENPALEVLRDQAPLPVGELCGILNELVENSGKEVILLGDGASVYREKLEESLLAPHFYAPASLNEQRASSVAVRGMEMLRAGKKETAAEHRPVYLRISQAERVRAEKEKKDAGS